MNRDRVTVLQAGRHSETPSQIKRKGKVKKKIVLMWWLKEKAAYIVNNLNKNNKAYLISIFLFSRNPRGTAEVIL